MPYSLLPLLLALAAPGQAGQKPADPCAASAAACRHVDSIRIESPDGKAEDMPVDQTLPWVVQENILILPGESVTVTLAKKDGYLAPVLARAGPASASTPPGEGEIRITVSESARGRIMMEVESHYGEALDYAALMVANGKPQRTSVCTLMPGIKIFENWVAPITQLALWHFQPSGEQGCKTIELGNKASPR